MPQLPEGPLSELPGDPDVPEQPNSEPSGEPSVEFAAVDKLVNPGDPVQLSWSASNVSACQAGGGWSGARSLHGSTVVGPIDERTTFSLTCTGDAGNTVAMLSVSVLGTVSLTWHPPSENVDGSPLTDLARYRIYYGSDSGTYTDNVTVGSATRSRNIRLASGAYYFAMTAVDGEGNESDFSNEVIKVVN